MQKYFHLYTDFINKLKVPAIKFKKNPFEVYIADSLTAPVPGHCLPFRFREVTGYYNSLTYALVFVV